MKTIIIATVALLLGACSSDGNSSRSWSVDYKSPLTSVKAKGESTRSQPVEDVEKETK